MAAPRITPAAHLTNSTEAPSQSGARVRPLTAHIGKYIVEAEITEGLAVQVLQGFDRDTRRPVTLKVLTDITDPALQERFRREIAAAAGVHHPSFVAIYELGEHVGLPFAAMQHLDGDELGRLLQAQIILPLLDRMMILWQVGEGIRAAHAAGIGHLGIHPSGIVLAKDGSVIIRDFGIVRPHRDDSQEYAAPEEISGSGPSDSLCDVFAFGLVFYYLLAGRHPFASDDTMGRSVDILRATAAPLRTLAPECPEELERIVSRALEKRRELRYQTLEDLQFDVEPILRELKRTRAAALLENASRLATGGAPEDAQRMLRDILELDPDNRQAQQLRAGIRLQLEQQSLQLRIKDLLREAENEAAARNFQRSADCLAAALQLDPENTAAKDRLQEIQLLRDRSDEAIRLVAEARELLARQNPSEARWKVLNALDRDAETPGGLELFKAIEEQIQRQEQDAEIERGLAEAKSLLLVESFEQAIAVLESLRSEYYDSPKIEHWLEHVRAQKSQVERKARLQNQLSRAESLMEARRFLDAADLLDKLIVEFPGEAQVQALRTEAAASAAKASAVARALQMCDEFRVETKLDQALAVLDAALASYPDEPELVAMRAEVEQRKAAIQSAVAVRAAMQEVRWLVDKDRPDLAAQFLREKLSQLPGDPTLLSHLGEIERGLPQWEQRRLEQEAIHRAAQLEEKQQWTAALTVLEEALKSCPESIELGAAAERFRERIREQEQRKKLARRLDAIRQKMDAHAWPQALSLIEAAQQEYPEESAWKTLLEQVRAGLQQSESEAIAAEVRQCLTYGDTEQAEEILRRALERLPGEPTLDALREEVKSARQYHEDLREAQILFGRGQFTEAESILTRLATKDRPDVHALLETVRNARLAGDAEAFYEQERERVQSLIQDEQYSQAAGLLRDLLSRFPGDPILIRSLTAVEGRIRENAAKAKPPEHSAPANQPAAPAENPPAVPTSSPAGTQRASLPVPETGATAQKRPAGNSIVRPAAVAVVLISVAVGAWELRQKPAKSQPESQPVPTSAPVPPAITTNPTKETLQPAATQAPAAARPRNTARETAPVREATRPFVPPPDAPVARIQVALPTPPGATAGSISGRDSLPLPSSMGQAINAPPPPANAPAPANPAASKPPTKVEEAQPISRRMPKLPDFARVKGISGTVRLEAAIDQTGAVTGVKVLSGNPVLANEAKNAVMQWKYKPAMLNGKPVGTTVQIQVSFQAPKP